MLLIGRRKNISQIEEAYEPDAELQWWYFDAVLDSGHRFITFFLPKTLGAIEGNDPDQPMLDIVLRKPDGETVSERRYFQPSEMKPVPGTFGADFGEECSARFEE